LDSFVAEPSSNSKLASAKPVDTGGKRCDLLPLVVLLAIFAGLSVLSFEAICDPVQPVRPENTIAKTTKRARLVIDSLIKFLGVLSAGDDVRSRYVSIMIQNSDDISIRKAGFKYAPKGAGVYLRSGQAPKV
jgi:hypothetical protein